MRAMILGAGGMLGHDLVSTAPPGIALFAFTRSDLDITNTDLLASTVADVRPNVIINAAAYTAVDRAESEAEFAVRVNGDAVGELGHIAARTGARVLHFSTDYVFDGTTTKPYEEDSPTNPVNAYGASKLVGERALRKSGADFLILRTQWLFGLQGRSFPRAMWERANAGLRTMVVRDQTGRPTYTWDLARTTWILVERRVFGVLHVANEGEATWFDLAVPIFARLGKTELLTPCTTEWYSTAAPRPRYSVLNTTLLASQLDVPLPSWRCALDHFLQRLASEVPR